MSEVPAAAASERHEHLTELRKESYATALYVAICLLAALIALPEPGDAREHVIRIIWGVTIGLAVAHWFAFRVSARLVGAGSVSTQDLESAAAQLAAAAAVALLASVPVFFFAESAELAAVELLLAAFIGLVGFAVARGGGATRARALIYALSVGRHRARDRGPEERPGRPLITEISPNVGDDEPLERSPEWLRIRLRMKGFHGPAEVEWTRRGRHPRLGA